MPPLLTASQRAANALRRAETALRNWQDDPDSPRADVDQMLAIIEDMRTWVQGHVLADVELAAQRLRTQAVVSAEAPRALPPLRMTE